MYCGIDTGTEYGGEVMLAVLKEMMGEGVSKAIDSIKQIAIDTWHISPEKAKQLDLEKERITNDLQMKVMGEVSRVLELENADRASARARETVVKDLTPALIAGAIIAGFFSIVWYMLLYTVPVESQRILDMMLGALMTSFTGIIAYYFGSSSSSAVKHNLIEKMMQK